jgi:hypothetical protein
MQKSSLQFLIFNVAFLIVKICVLFVFVFSASAPAQDLPKKIRGYKVYQAEINIKNQSDKTDSKNKSDAFINVGEPQIVAVSAFGITFELPAEIESLQQSGTIDFLTFRDFRVNDLAVEVEEYKESFEVEKNRLIALPKPVKIFVGVDQALRGAAREWQNSKDEWTVSGRVLVFGRFKKYGFSFKRVVPIEINVKIKNPLKTAVNY